MHTIRWLMGLAVITASATGTLWLLWPSEVVRLREENQQLNRQNEMLMQSVERLTGEDRVAEIHVIDQIRPGDLVNGRPADDIRTIIEFIEIDRQGNTLPARRFEIGHDVLFFDALVIKFDADDVAAGDALRGKNLSLFRRIYGENQRPMDGYPIDPENQVPDIYRVHPKPSEFERELWKKFWDYATDPELAKQEGVSVAQGEAVYVPMSKGDGWLLTMQNNGGLNLKLVTPGRENPIRLQSEATNRQYDTADSQPAP